MALNAIGGLARGLASGINMGMQWRNQQELIDVRKKEGERLAKADERDAEIHELRKDQYASEKEIRDRRNNALKQIADYTTQAFGGAGVAAPAQNAPSTGAAQAPVNLAGPVPQGGLAMNAPEPTGAPAGALAPAPQAPQPQQPQQAEIKPGKILERGMVTGMYTPKMLTDIAGIFAKNGLHEEGLKYMEQAYTAEKRGVVRAATALMQNNPGAAAQALAAGGVDLEGLPVKVKPDDPNDMNWKINIKGQGEKTVNVRDWTRSTMDPEEFFKAEDRRIKDDRKADLDERKLKLDEKKTDAQIGYLNSRSELAEANADKADRWEPGAGGLRASRSSESQINTAIKRRDTAFDRVSSVKDIDTGKFEIDPVKRQVLDSAANQYLTFLEERRGEELDAREHHKFTDAMLSYPVKGTPEQIEQWQNKEFLPRFGIRRKAKPGAETPAQGQEQRRGLSPAPEKPAGPKPGSLAAMKEKEKARQAVKGEMDAVQRALQTPNLNTEQKKTLALKAQELAKRRDALK